MEDENTMLGGKLSSNLKPSGLKNPKMLLRRRGTLKSKEPGRTVRWGSTRDGVFEHPLGISLRS